MGLLDMLTGRLLEPKLVHSLPGRLRVHVPALLELPEEMKPMATELSKILQVGPPIDSVSLDLRSGNILLCYCQKSAREEQIVGFVRALLKLLYDNRKRFTGLGKDMESKVTEFRSHLANTISSDLSFPKKVVDDVWS